MNDQSGEAAEIITPEGAAGQSLVLPNQLLPDFLHIFPVHSRPFFPAQIQPVALDAETWERTFKAISQHGQPVAGLIYSPDAVDEPDVTSLPAIGCAVRLHNVTRQGDKIQFVAQGIKRFRVRQWISEQPPLRAHVAYPEAPEEDEEALRAHAMAVIGAIKDLLPLNPLYGEELKQYLNYFSPNEPSPLADFAASLTTVGGGELQEVLETIPLLRRMEKVLFLLHKELEVGRLKSQISEQVNQKVSEQQRQFFLREQLKVIQQELGIAKDDKTADADEFRARLDDKAVPDVAMRRIDDELKKLSVLEPGSPEYGVTRNYLDWTTALPWGVHSADNLDIGHARKVLDEHHSGLADVKKRIIEFLAVGAFKGEVGGSIILLVGPPGVGKTSIGRSIAEALGRQFYRFSVGGMRDEAEIKGHRRTYIGAMPGKFMQALKDVGVENPVIMLDEVDKIGAAYQGDPASALLEALDPEQNGEFLDHYIDLRVDLSKVLFVCTANQLDTIPAPLLDRMEVIRLAGYIADEKLEIARRHLWPKQLERAGLKPSRLKISDGALKHVIDGYAREAGVRNLEKQLGRLVRKSVVDILEGGKDKKRRSINIADVERYLGKPSFRPERPVNSVGVVTGLAWTPLGGATLAIEASRIHALGRGFKLTGKLGDVMRESAEIAYSYVMSNLRRFGCAPEFFDESLVHLHVPEGATPKDGPSAGVTMATALLSLASGRRPLRSLAMTGELTLTGQVLPVGGIREKVIAARRAKVTTIVLPDANASDFDELPEYLKQGLEVHFAKRFDDVRRVAFGEDKPSGR